LLCEDIQDQIDLKLTVAHKALKEAVELSEKFSVPFESDISPLENVYVPKSFQESKFGELEIEDTIEAANVGGDYVEELFFENGGWINTDD